MLPNLFAAAGKEKSNGKKRVKLSLARPPLPHRQPAASVAYHGPPGPKRDVIAVHFVVRNGEVLFCTLDECCATAFAETFNECEDTSGMAIAIRRGVLLRPAFLCPQNGQSLGLKARRKGGEAHA